MQYLITALGIVISALMGLPSRNNASSEVQKRKIGKTLAELVFLFDSIINNGYIILNYLNNGIEYKENIVNLLKLQIKDLKKVSSEIQMNLLWGDALWNISDFDMFQDFYYKKTNINKILSIYGPKLNPSLHIIIEYKTEILGSITELLYQKFEKTPSEDFYIYEIEEISQELLVDQMMRFTFIKEPHLFDNYKDKLLKFKKINLLYAKERAEYIAIALKRSDIIKQERDKLAEFIRTNYAPHQIV